LPVISLIFCLIRLRPFSVGCRNTPTMLPFVGLLQRKMWYPKKSKPSMMWVIVVFSSLSSRPNSSWRKPLQASLISCAWSFVPRTVSRVRKSYCYDSLPSELGVRLSPHPAQAHHEQHGFLLSFCFDGLEPVFSSV